MRISDWSSDVCSSYLDTFERLRSGALRTLGSESLTGIITFPSFPAAAAVLLGWGFASFGMLGWPLVALNTLQFVSAIVGDRTSVVQGKRVSGRVDLGGRDLITNTKRTRLKQ